MQIQVGRTFKITKLADESYIWLVDGVRLIEPDELLIIETAKGMNANLAVFDALGLDQGKSDFPNRPSVEHRGQVFAKLYDGDGNTIHDVLGFCNIFGVVPSANFVERITAPTGGWEPTRRSQIGAPDELEADAATAHKAAKRAAKLAKRGLNVEPSARQEAFRTKGAITVGSRIDGVSVFAKHHPAGGIKGPGLSTPHEFNGAVVKDIGTKWWTLQVGDDIWYVREWSTAPTPAAAAVTPTPATP